MLSDQSRIQCGTDFVQVSKESKELDWSYFYCKSCQISFQFSFDVDWLRDSILTSVIFQASRGTQDLWKCLKG